MAASLESQLAELQLNDPLADLSQGEIDDIAKMTGISYLELSNFKSYADYHYIGPFSNFSCIIGPNGGGNDSIFNSLLIIYRKVKHLGCSMFPLLH
jgi:hypothetical protein